MSQFKPERVTDTKHLRGATITETFDMPTIAERLFPSKRIEDGLFLFAYMFRRFGPPSPSDPYKTMGQWTLTTPVDNLFLNVIGNAYPLDCCFGVRYTKDVYERLCRSGDSDLLFVDECNDAIEDAMEDLLTPTRCRDVYFNCRGDCHPKIDPATEDIADGAVAKYFEEK